MKLMKRMTALFLCVLMLGAGPVRAVELLNTFAETQAAVSQSDVETAGGEDAPTDEAAENGTQEGETDPTGDSEDEPTDEAAENGTQEGETDPTGDSENEPADETTESNAQEESHAPVACAECGQTEGHAATCSTRCSCGEYRLKDGGHIGTCILYACPDCGALLNQAGWTHSCGTASSQPAKNTTVTADDSSNAGKNKTVDADAYASNVGATAKFNPDSQLYVYLGDNPDNCFSQPGITKESFPENLELRINAYHIDGENLLFYKVEALPGQTLPTMLEKHPWVYQNDLDLIGTINEEPDTLILTKNTQPEKPDSIQTEVNGAQISVSGELPEGATLSATVPEVNGEKLPGVFDIKVMVGGKEWQPVDDDKTVTVSIPVTGVADGEYVNVFHIIDHAGAITSDAVILDISGAPDDIKLLLQDAIAACGGNDCVAVEMQQDVMVQNGEINILAGSFSIYVYDEANKEFDLAQNQSGEVSIPNITGGDRNYYYHATVGSTFTLKPQLLGLGSYSLESDQSTGVTVDDNWMGWNGLSAAVTLENVAVGDTVVIKYTGLSSGNNFWVHITIVREISITYSSNGKTATGMPDPLSETIATDGTIEITAAAAPTATNCTFKGWDTSPAGDGVRYQAGATFVPLQDTVLYAIWETDKYNVTFDPNGGSGTATTKEVAHGATIVFPDPPLRENYTFLGWCATKDGHSTRYPAGSTTTITAAATFYAIWGADLTLTVSGDIAEIKMMEGTEQDWKDLSGFAQAGNSYNKEDVEGYYKGTTFRITAAGDSNFNAGAGKAYTSTGSVVHFWTEDGGKTLFVQLTEGVTKDTAITVTTEKDKFTVSYVPNGGAAVEPDVVSSGSSIDLNSKTTTRDGYTFAGWYSDAALTQEVTGAVTITAHTTFYAKWTANGYTITYDLDGGSLGSGVTNPGQYNTETEDFTLNNPTKEGYTFAGWTGTGLSEAAMEVTVTKGSTGNRSYTAEWTENKATLSYVAVGPAGEAEFGTVTPESEELFVVTGDAKGSVAQAGNRYRFMGWYSDEACEQQISTDKKFVPTKGADEIWSSKTYYAKFDYGYADLTISTTCPDASQSFIFTVTGSDGFSMDVVVHGNKSVTIKGLLIGTYTVTENTDWSWRYSIVYEEKRIELIAGRENKVEFGSDRTMIYWLSGDSYCEKKFTVETHRRRKGRKEAG